jgi:hypothetical protein
MKTEAVDVINPFNNTQDTRFEVFTAVKIQVEVFWVVTRCSVAVG